MLMMYAHQRNHRFTQQVCSVIDGCLDDLCERPVVDRRISRYDDLVDILDRNGRSTGTGTSIPWTGYLWHKSRFSRRRVR